MKTHIISALLVLLNFGNLYCQDCFPEILWFKTQVSVDSFSIRYPDCTHISGNLYINGSGIKNLLGLQQITSIDGALAIYGNDSLPSLEGLQNITKVGKLYFAGNSSLSDFKGLEGLTVIGDTLSTGSGFGFEINSSAKLKSLEGLSNVQVIYGGIQIRYTDSLTDLSGLRGLRLLNGGMFLHYNNALVDLNGLQGLTSMTSSLSIFKNDALISLRGLENITEIRKYINISMYENNILENIESLYNLSSIGEYINITIKGNFSLKSLKGLDNIDYTKFRYVTISRNNFLKECAIKSICEYLLSPYPSGIIEINNNFTGCSSEEQIIATCTTVDTTISIRPNPVYSSFEVSGPNILNSTYELFDAMGRSVQKGILDGEPVDVTILLRGVYIFRINKGGELFVRQIVKW